MRKFLRGRLQGYGRAYRLNLKDTGWGMKLVVLVITGFFCGALASEYFGTFKYSTSNLSFHIFLFSLYYSFGYS